MTMNRAARRAAATALTGLLMSLAPITGPSATTHTDGELTGTAFGQTCGQLTLIAVPGSNETSEAAGRDDAKAVLASVTSTLTAHTDTSVRTHYLGYPATLTNYGDSRRHGYEAAWSTVRYYARQCPTTRFILLGYSQGAHIAGDLATTVGTSGSPISPDRIRSVRLLADPARNRAAGHLVGMSDPGAGGMFADRGGFGDLADRVTEYCVAADPICNLTVSAAARTVASLRVESHTSYSTTHVPGTDDTFTERIAADLAQDIVNLDGVTY